MDDARVILYKYKYLLPELWNIVIQYINPHKFRLIESIIQAEHEKRRLLRNFVIMILDKVLTISAEGCVYNNNCITFEISIFTTLFMRFDRNVKRHIDVIKLAKNNISLLNEILYDELGIYNYTIFFTNINGFDLHINDIKVY